MGNRQIVRTLTLSTTLFQADKEIDELEFFEPSSTIFDELEKAQEWNAHAKKRRQIVATGLILLAQLTGLHEATLASMSFKDRKAANAIAAEIMGDELNEGEA